MEKIRILLVEDNKIDQKVFEYLIEKEKLPYDYNIASTAADARKCLEGATFDIVIMDHILDDGTAFDLLEFIGDTPFIISIGAGYERAAVEALKCGASDYLIKEPGRESMAILPFIIEKAIRKKRAEAQIRMMSHAVMSIADSVYFTDLTGKIIFVNKAFCKTYGFKQDEILGKDASLLLAEDPPQAEALPESLQEGWIGEVYHRRKESRIRHNAPESQRSCHFYHQRKDGSEFPVAISRSVIRDERGSVIALLEISRDITERKKIEQTILEYSRELEEKNVELQDFARTVCHDLKTPLFVITSHLELLKRNHWIAPEGLSLIENVINAGFDMSDFITKLLKLSRAGQVVGEYKSINLNRALPEIFQKIKPDDVQADLEFVSDLPIIQADPTRIRQVFQNLIENSISHRDRGRERLRIIIGCEENRQEFLFRIEDDGGGILPQHIDKIFNLGFSAKIKECVGTGFGLFISRKIIEAHGGKIWAESKGEGKGAVFSFTIKKV